MIRDRSLKIKWMVALMVFVVMPQYTKFVRRWLFNN